MSKSLAQLITTTQALLLDDGTHFSTATVTAAIRAALKDFNRAAPVWAGTLMDVVSGQKEYVLNSSDFATLLDVQSVLLRGTDTLHEYSAELAHDFYFEDNAPVIRLRMAEANGYLIVRYSQPNTISGLDSATESTVPAYFDDTLTDGACYWSCVIRSTGRVETINLNQGVSENLGEIKEFYRQAFAAGLIQAARRKSPVSEPNTAAWNDVYTMRTI
jgi:hypothetical protein